MTKRRDPNKPIALYVVPYITADAQEHGVHRLLFSVVAAYPRRVCLKVVAENFKTARAAQKYIDGMDRPRLAFGAVYERIPCSPCRGTGRLRGVRAKAGSPAAVCRRKLATCGDCGGAGYQEWRQGQPKLANDPEMHELFGVWKGGK